MALSNYKNRCWSFNFKIKITRPTIYCKVAVIFSLKHTFFILLLFIFLDFSMQPILISCQHFWYFSWQTKGPNSDQASHRERHNSYDYWVPARHDADVHERHHVQQLEPWRVPHGHGDVQWRHGADRGMGHDVMVNSIAHYTYLRKRNWLKNCLRINSQDFAF